MQDLKSALDKADGKAPGPNHVEARFIKALPAPVQWLLVHSYRAILRGAPPPMHWRDAHIWLSPKVPGSARPDDYRPIALGQLDKKLLTGPLTQRITEVLTRHGVVSDWQQGALPGSNTGPPLFMCPGMPPSPPCAVGRHCGARWLGRTRTGARRVALARTGCPGATSGASG